MWGITWLSLISFNLDSSTFFITLSSRIISSTFLPFKKQSSQQNWYLSLLPRTENAWVNPIVSSQNSIVVRQPCESLLLNSLKKSSSLNFYYSQTSQPLVAKKKNTRNILRCPMHSVPKEGKLRVMEESRAARWFLCSGYRKSGRLSVPLLGIINC